MAQTIDMKEFEEEKQIIIPLADLEDGFTPEDAHEEKILELQLMMATTSINHEYAKIEFDEVDDYERRHELLDYMADCRGKYLSARSQLANFNPLVLETFERDLLLQKLATITHYNA